MKLAYIWRKKLNRYGDQGLVSYQRSLIRHAISFSVHIARKDLPEEAKKEESELVFDDKGQSLVIFNRRLIEYQCK